MNKIKENRKPFYNTTIPSDWEVKELAELALVMKSGLSRKLSNNDIGLPVIRSNNLVNNMINFNNIKFWHKVDNQGANTKNYYLEEGDILVNFINSISQIGKCAYFTNSLNRSVIFTTNILSIKLDEKKINSKFFLYHSLLSHYRKFIDSITKPAINQASFTTKDYNKLKLPLPSLFEQNAITTHLSAWDKAINTTQKLIEQKELRKKWLMQNLLTGKKRLKGFIGEWKTKTLKNILTIAGKPLSPIKDELYQQITQREYSIKRKLQEQNWVTNECLK
jgi:type I restriction enzyme S subunit